MERIISETTESEPIYLWYSVERIAACSITWKYEIAGLHCSRKSTHTLLEKMYLRMVRTMRIGRNFNVGRLTALEAVQDVVEALFGLRNDYIKFPITEAESELPNIVGAIDESHIRMATLQAVLWTISVAISNMNSLSILLWLAGNTS